MQIKKNKKKKLKIYKKTHILIIYYILLDNISIYKNIPL